MFAAQACRATEHPALLAALLWPRHPTGSWACLKQARQPPAPCAATPQLPHVGPAGARVRSRTATICFELMFVIYVFLYIIRTHIHRWSAFG